MRQVSVYGPEDIRIDDVPNPEPGPNDVTVAVKACGICGTDVTTFKVGGVAGPTREPTPLGHEFSGVVHAVGKHVTGVLPGDRVVVNPMAAGNLIGGGGPEGGFADYVLIRNANQADVLHSLPQGISYEIAALTEPLAVGLHGVKTAMPNTTSKVVVFGAGCIGIGTVMALKQAGVGHILSVDVSDYRLDKALAAGADKVVNPRRMDLYRELVTAHGEADCFGDPVWGTDIFIDATGVDSVVQQALNYGRQGATIVLMGLQGDDARLNLSKSIVREHRIVGSSGYPEEFSKALKLLLSMDKSAQSIISHRFSLEQFDAAMKVALDTNQSCKVMIEID